MDAKKMVNLLKLKGEAPSKGQFNLYLDKKTFGDFRRLCEESGIAASRIVEQFMREFIDSAQKGDKR